MKIEHKLVEDGWGFFVRLNLDRDSRGVSFCATRFRFYFKFGRKRTIFFITSDRKPAHSESFKLVRKGTDTFGVKRWRFDLDARKYPKENMSPWMFSFDRYLTRTFGNTKPVYIWVEYE